MDAALQLSSRTKIGARVGLGQCIKEMSLGPWWDMDFCSKQIFKNGEDFSVFRDYRKVLATRNAYTGSNAAIRNNPAIHAEAISKGLQSEKASRLLEDIVRLRWGESILNDELASLYFDRVKYALKDESVGYQFEPQINRFLGICEYSFISAALTNDVRLNGRAKRRIFNWGDRPSKFRASVMSGKVHKIDLVPISKQ
jgi:hypothetical protein